MPGHDMIVIGFSAGGVEALTRVIPDLPADLPAAILIVHHFPAHSISALPRILTRVGRLPAAHAIEGERIRPGRIYVSCPERHLLVNGDRIQLSRGPKENGNRPAIDPLFRTAARSYGSRVIGVLLSGTLDDGTAGLEVIRQSGGVTVVQRPDDALFGDMPAHALQFVPVDYAETAAGLGPLLTSLVLAPTTAMPERAVPPNAEPDPEAIRQILLTGAAGDPVALVEPEHSGAGATLRRPASSRRSR